MTFGRWRHQLHLIVALRQIASGATVQQVAGNLGYNSVTAFITMFRGGLVAIAQLGAALSKQPLDSAAKIAHELTVLRRSAVLLALLVAILSSGGMFTVMTYIAPLLEHAGRIQSKAIGLFLVLLGLGFTLGG